MTVIGCSADGQGGGVLAMGELAVADSRFEANKVSKAVDGQGGGALFANSGLKVLRSAFVGNVSAGNAGAIACSAGCIATVGRASFSGNAAAIGGALHVMGAASVVNSSFIENAATLNGGAIAAAGALTLLHVTAYGNSAPNVAAVMANGSLSMQNSLIGGSLGGDDCAAAAWVSNLGNLVEDGSCNPAVQAPAGPGTVGTCNGLMIFQLATGAAALGAANAAGCASQQVGGVDQCGVARPTGTGCDVGATEQ